MALVAFIHREREEMRAEREQGRHAAKSFRPGVEPVTAAGL